MIKIKLADIKKKNPDIVALEISDDEPGHINSLRRVFMNEVPVMAIEDVEFRNNDSGLYDEIIAHRLGLIPFTTDLKSYNLPSECKCKGEGCARCQLKMVLKAKGPGMAYASDIKIKDTKIKPVHPKTPIVKLLEGQKLEFEATAVLGKGKEHAKWSPCLSFYREMADIKVEKQPDNKEQIVERCPKNVFEIKNNKLAVKKDKVIDCTICDECVELGKGAIKVAPNGKYLMIVESWGQLKPKDIVAKGVEVFDAQLDEFSNLLKKIK